VRDRAASGGFLPGEATPDVRMREDLRLPAEERVPSRMVSVPVGVQDELDLPLVDVLHGRADLLREGRELVVDEEDAVRADGDADVPAGSLEHVDVSCDVRRADLDVVEILCRR